MIREYETAGYPALYILTQEPHRAEDMLAKESEGKCTPFAWDILRGIREASTLKVVEQALDPVDFVDALGEVVGEPEPLADLIEDPEVGFGLAQRLDRRRLENDDAMIELLLAMMAVAAETGPFADIGPLEIGTGGQDNVG